MSVPETIRLRAVAPTSRSRPAVSLPAPKSARPVQRARISLLFGDLFATQASLLLALLAAEARFGVSEPGRPLYVAAVVLGLYVPLVAALSGLYPKTRRPSWRRQGSAGLRVLAWTAGASVLGLFLFARDITWTTRFVFGLHHFLLGVWFFLGRPVMAAIVDRWLRDHVDAERVLVIGADSVAAEVARNLGRSTPGVLIIGFASPDRARGNGATPHHRTAYEDIPELARQLSTDLVLVARPDLPREQVVLLTDQLVASGVRVQVVSNVFNQLVDSVPFDTVNGVPLVPVGQTPLRGHNEKWKRAFDLLATTMGGLVILPFLALLAFLVKLNSPGPVLYTQTRVGKGGRPFAFYKFRSMRVAKEDQVHRDYAEELVRSGDAATTDEKGKKIYKLVDETRVTSIGRFLRRTSLDELPQLLNVLRGEMSLVGPRPCLPFEYELYKDWQKRRLDVTPGMTGLWQVTGRSYVTFEDMVLLDLFYIANWSLLMDFQILLRTAPVVIFGKGGM